MNYRHIYHAGSFTDVFKHMVLSLIIQSLLNKDKPFCYIDTHAGIGLYDLQQEAAQKTQEHLTGITLLLEQAQFPELIKPYLSAVASYNTGQTANHFYPGSPCVVDYFLRPQDKMILAELHEADVKTLRQVFKNNKQTQIYHADGYQLLKAQLPPKERRGIVLIDPPYEQGNEYNAIKQAIIEALNRWATGIYAIWYPIKDKILVEKFLREIKLAVSNPMLIAELSVYAEDVNLNLNGSGILIINPPWQLDEKLNQLLPWLWQILSPNKRGGYRVF